MALTARISLAPEEANRALAILQQEALALRPSRFQRRAYLLLNLDVALLAVALIMVFVAQWARGGQSAVTVATFGLLGFASIAIAPLFVLNVPLVWKLWSVSRVRRRLGLAEPLAAAFKAERHKAWLLNLATVAVTVFGALLLLTAAARSMLLPTLKDTLFRDIAVYLALGLPFASLHLIRRGMERLAVVDRLRARLSAAASGADSEVSPDDYELIARIERTHIIAERYQSVEQHQGSAAASGYAVHVGVDAQQAKSRLDTAERLLVDDQIMRLTEDPEPAGAVRDADPARRRLAVPDTSAEIVFDVDHAARRIKIVRIASPMLDSIGYATGGN